MTEKSPKPAGDPQEIHVCTSPKLLPCLQLCRRRQKGDVFPSLQAPCTNTGGTITGPKETVYAL